MRNIIKISLLLGALTCACGFMAPCGSLAFRVPVALKVSSVANFHHDELSYRQMLVKARECAFSDNSSPQEARKFLDEIFHMESLCASGTVAGDVCDDVDEVAMVVARLREMAADTVETHASSANVALSAMVWPSIFLLPILVAWAAMFDWAGRSITPFELQEWMWAAQGGYLGTMFSHFARNGGL